LTDESNFTVFSSLIQLLRETWLWDELAWLWKRRVSTVYRYVYQPWSIS